MQIEMETIGTIEAKRGFAIKLDSKWRPGLLGLEGFGHIVVLWCANRGQWKEENIRMPEPYRGGPAEVGIFATRSPVRPNGLGMSVASIAGVDPDTGRIDLGWIDAEDGTPVIDIKPYHPSSDRVESPVTPAWCSSWPRSLEKSAAFDWSKVFNFG